MRKIILSSAMAGTLLVGGCASSGPNQKVGTVGGAVVGGLIGNAIAPRGPGGAIVGAVVGGLIGGAIGQELDEQARREAYDAELYALENDRPRDWTSGGGKYRGRIVPKKAYVDNGGRRCKEYQHTIYINGNPKTAAGVACKQPDGTWSKVS